MTPITLASIGLRRKLTVWIGIVYVQLRKLDAKTENYEQNNERH